jgi:hypothetical protein
MGTSAFILTTLDPTCSIHATGANRVPGPGHSQAAYRSEVAGILSLLILCELLTTLDPRIKGHLIIGCDNQEAGRRAITFQQPPRPTDEHSDLLFLCYSICQRLAQSWSFQYHYVEGHQRKKYGSNRDQWGILNDQMDSLAKAYLVWRENRPPSIITPPWSVQVHDETVSRHFKSTLRTWVQHQKQIAWWYQTKKFTPSQVLLMDHSAIAQAMKHTSEARHRWICKFAANQGPTGRNMKRWRFWATSQCPRCLAENETTDHILQCPHPSAVLCRKTALAQLVKTLDDLFTHPRLRTLMTKNIKSWCNNLPPWQPPLLPDDVSKLVDNQTALGWHWLLRGRLTTDWALLQNEYYTNIQHRSTGKLWAGKAIAALWDYSWTLWDHRNDHLHNSDVANKLLDMASIDNAIKREWTRGVAGLDVLDQLQFRGMTLRKLLKSNRHTRIVWLDYVCNARLAAQQS